MNVNHTEYGIEYTFHANDEWDQVAYVYFLWFQKQTPAQQEETRIWWFGKDGLYSFSDSNEPILVSVLPSTRDETPSRTQGKRRKKDKGTTKGAGEMAMFKLRETNESYSDKGNELTDYLEHYHDC